jgi:hypothetical protein
MGLSSIIPSSPLLINSHHYIANLLKEEKKQPSFLKIKKQEPTFVKLLLITW